MVVIDPLLHKGSPQTSPAPRIQTPPNPPPGSQRKQDSQKPGPGENTWEGKDVRLLPMHGPGPGSPAFQPMGLPPTVLLAHLLLPDFSSSLPSLLAITWVEEGSLFLFQFFTTASWGGVG